MKDKLVSIITPVYNAERFISEMIESVLAQSYGDWELVLVNDCSSDNSVSIIEKYQKTEPRIVLLSNTTNLGSGESRNRAIKEAHGRFIAFLDADDIWTPDKLEKHVQFMLDKQAVFSHTSYGYMNESGEIIKKPLIVSDHPVTYKALLKRTEISCLTAMYDASRIGKYYMTTHRRKQDYALWLSILKDGHVSEPLNEVLAYYRQSNTSATSKKSKLILKHVQFLRESQGLSWIASIYYTAFWMLNGVMRYYIKR